MTTNPNDPPGKDSWTDLAQNLFGIEFSDPASGDELISDEDLDLDEPDEVSEAETPAVSDEAEPPAGEASFEIDAEDETLAGFADVEIAAAETGKSAEIEESTEIVATDVSDDSSESAPEESAPQEEDTYWNTLESWNWSAESEETRPSTSRSGRPGTPGRASRQERSPSRGSTSSRSAAAPKTSPPKPPQQIASRDEYQDDSGFGAGILDEFTADCSTSSQAGAIDTESAPVADVPEAGEGDRPPRKRRRRRRRRPRREEGESAESTETSAAESPLSPEEPSESEPVAADSPAPAEKPTSRRRSSGGRRGSRGPRSDVTQTAQDEASFEQTPEDVAAGETTQSEQPPQDDESTSSKRKSPNYKDIPTWEETVSCLLQANQTASRSSDSANGPSGKAKRDSSRRTGRRRRSRP